VPSAVIHSAAVFAHFMSPALYNPTVRRREYASITILNAFTLAVACWCADHPAYHPSLLTVALPTAPGLHAEGLWGITHHSSAVFPGRLMRMRITPSC